MNLLRSMTRRGFEVGTAGWFTVLKPNTWFPASRLPSFNPGRSRTAIVQGQPTLHSSQQAAPPPRIVGLIPSDRNSMRIALATIVAIAITSIMLCWICIPR